MKSIRMTPLFFRRVHKWVGLVIGIQFILWSVSGAMMAMIDMEGVKGPLPSPEGAIPAVALADPASLGIDRVEQFSLRTMDETPVYELRNGPDVLLFDAEAGTPILIDRDLIARRAKTFSSAPINRIEKLPQPNLESRDFAGQVWRVDFNDESNTSAYYSASTAELLVARTDTWRWWDFFWMLHNMDYINRSSFNHPLIVIVAFGALFLSGTGFYLLFKSFTKRDFKWIRKKPGRPQLPRTSSEAARRREE